MTVELVRVLTADDVGLDGALYPAADGTTNPLSLDGFLLIHGTGGNFYAPGVLECFAITAASTGTPALRINTRGHDGLSGSGGAAFEDIDRCRFDLAAWLELVADRGWQKVALVGHSMGGVKALYATAHDVVADAVIAISPPRFCHQSFQDHPDADAFREDYQRSLELVAAGKGTELIRVRQPLPLWITAEGYLAKYGPEDRYDLVRHLPGVACPVLVIVGRRTVSSSPAFSSLPEDLAGLDLPADRLSIEVVDEADMEYANNPAEPFRRATDWLQGSS